MLPWQSWGETGKAYGFLRPDNTLCGSQGLWTQSHSSECFPPSSRCLLPAAVTLGILVQTAPVFLRISNTFLGNFRTTAYPLNFMFLAVKGSNSSCFSHSQNGCEDPPEKTDMQELLNDNCSLCDTGITPANPPLRDALGPAALG